MKIGILQTGHLHESIQSIEGNYDRIFGELLKVHGFEPEVWPVVDGIFPSGPGDAGGWLITGSKFGAYEDHDWIPPLEDLIRKIHASGRPLVGICFGHQIIAKALGGQVEKFSGGWSIGRQVYQYNGQNTAIHAWHQDQVTRAPEGARIIASSEFCSNAGFVMGNRIWTIQPHPEFSESVIEGLLEHRAKGVVPNNLINEAHATLNKGTDRLDVLNDIADFFRRGAA